MLIKKRKFFVGKTDDELDKSGRFISFPKTGFGRASQYTPKRVFTKDVLKANKATRSVKELLASSKAGRTANKRLYKYTIKELSSARTKTAKKLLELRKKQNKLLRSLKPFEGSKTYWDNLEVIKLREQLTANYLKLKSIGWQIRSRNLFK